MEIISPVRARAQAENDLMAIEQDRRRNALLGAQSRHADQRMQFDQRTFDQGQIDRQRQEAAAAQEQQEAWIKNAIGLARRNPALIPSLVQHAKQRGLVPRETPDNLSPADVEELALYYGIEPTESGVKVGAYNPGDYTPESWAPFVQGGYRDPSGLRRAWAPAQERITLVNGVPTVVNPNTANQRPLSTPADEAAAAAARAAAEAGAKQVVATAAEIADKGRERGMALNMYEEARKGLDTALSATDTGPIVGRIPAVTAAQQTATGAVAAMAPILKQLFRSAGEGTFTDRDQALLLDMVPTRADHPEARDAKLANIDNIVRAKLGMGKEITAVATAPKPAPPKPGMVVKGYRFEGGDPANPASWVKVGK